ncbi:armadillo-type protein [Blyttiomyces helicus]|uniref:Armadillo-type protein n=1 Tax=Blyttiomyces helicus TaxID=388810 RepID=A0A4P9W5B2_9FUNG|nr:armadillo-type protein [Blyttiomyces helicus]|eukprot:RKO87591.1 armadillo-type protein [Blyttiomyces helicus]
MPLALDDASGPGRPICKALTRLILEIDLLWQELLVESKQCRDQRLCVHLNLKYLTNKILMIPSDLIKRLINRKRILWKPQEILDKESKKNADRGRVPDLDEPGRSEKLRHTQDIPALNPQRDPYSAWEPVICAATPMAPSPGWLGSDRPRRMGWQAERSGTPTCESHPDSQDQSYLHLMEYLPPNTKETLLAAGEGFWSEPSEHLALSHLQVFSALVLDPSANIQGRVAALSKFRNATTFPLFDGADEKQAAKLVSMLMDADDATRSSSIAMARSMAATRLKVPYLTSTAHPQRTDFQQLLSNFLQDPDEKTRACASRSLMTLWSTGVTPDASWYTRLSAMLKDDDEEIRASIMDIMWEIVRTNPDLRLGQQIKGKKIVRLTDDAFVKFCDMTNDSSERVRAKVSRILHIMLHLVYVRHKRRRIVSQIALPTLLQAFLLLGRFRNVTGVVLQQTLSKQLMSMKRQFDSRDQKQASDFDLETSGGDLLLDAASCGAFIHGLEDEYEEVRNSAVGEFSIGNGSFLGAEDAACALSLESEDFALKCLDFLVGALMLPKFASVPRFELMPPLHPHTLIPYPHELIPVLRFFADMFNDEMAAVRLNAVHSLRKIALRHTIVLDDEQLQTVLIVLQDASASVRDGAHRGLGLIKVRNPPAVGVLLALLVKDFLRFPEDTLSVYQALYEIGRNHKDLIEPLIPTLLRFDKQFLPQEVDLEDQTRKSFAYWSPWTGSVIQRERHFLSMYSVLIPDIANLMLIFGGCDANKNLAKVLPAYVATQAMYVRDKFASCFSASKVSRLLIIFLEAFLHACRGLTYVFICMLGRVNRICFG